jgi:[protein-PII] uridylyltransferase
MAAEQGAAAAGWLDEVRNAADVAVAARDRPGLFADLAGVLAEAGAQVLYARIHTDRTGQALDVFHIQDAAGAPFGEQDRGALQRLTERLAEAARAEARRAGCPRRFHADGRWRRPPPSCSTPPPPTSR